MMLCVFHLFLLHPTRNNKIDIKNEIFFLLGIIMIHDDSRLFYSSPKDQ